MNMNCYKCHKKLQCYQTYGSLFSFKSYCERCWYDFLLKKFKDEVRYWKIKLKDVTNYNQEHMR